MRKILYIALFSVLAVSAKAQIPINTFFDVSTPNPIDGRFVIPTLSDTSTITDLYDGLLTVVQNTDQLWQYDGTKWVQFQTGSSDNIYNTNGTITGNRTVTVGAGNSLNITTTNGDGQIYMEDGVGLQLGGNTSTPGGRETVNFPNVGGGLQYGADYSTKAGFGDRTIPDWGYVSGHTVDTLSSLLDTTAAANNVGRIAHVVDVDQKWTVNSAGVWEILSSGIAQSSLDTLWDYTALRAYTGSANAVYVNKPGLAGLFRRVASGTDNGGTVIVASNSVVWERDYQEGHIYVDWFGAVGDGVTDDAPAINAAIDNASGAQAGYNFYFTPGKTYLLENAVDDLNANLPATFWGYGATILRADEVVTTTTTATVSGATTIEVTDASAFSVGDRIILLDVTDAYGGTAEDETSANNPATVITDITGSTLIVDRAIQLPPSGNLSTEYPIGSKILKTYDLFSVPQGAETNFFGLSFDGNAAGNTSYRGWIGNSTISKLGDNSTVQDCYFTQSPNETIFTDSGVKILNNTADSLYGSLVHISATGKGKTIVSGNITNYTNLATQEVSQHAEAVYTCSVNTDTVIIANNIAQNGVEYLYGPHNPSDDHTVSITGNIATNMGGAVWFTSNVPSTISGNVIINSNSFTNCTALVVENIAGQGSITNNSGHYGYNISDNLFNNTRIRLSSVHRLKFSNNDVVFDSSYVTDVIANNRSAIIFSGTNGFFEVVNNTIEQYDSSLTNGIVYNILTSPGIKERYLTMARFNISGNTILNFPNGIVNKSVATGDRSYSFANSKISNNIIVNYTSTANNEPETIGIWADPGVHVYDNILWGQPSVDNNLFSTRSTGILIRGVDTLLRDSIMGPIVYDNTVYGFTESLEIGNHTPNGLEGNSCYNIICKDNYYSGLIDDNNIDTNHPNIVTGNIQITDLPKNSLPHVFGGTAFWGLLNDKKYRYETLYSALLRAYTVNQRNRAK